MRRRFGALVLAASLLAPVAAGAADEDEGAAETKPIDRGAELRRQRDEATARRDRALLNFHTFGLPKYSLEVEEAARELERLEKELAEVEKGGAEAAR